ncbi:hypothetical protein ACNPQM_32360 [Streptomyces sp. NPDC056231]|uniref:hypothetical protein n=1 Tax=Streptomyces sp. NPDC056231 TaxID=3345755 RepID=UPI003AAB693D
MPDFPDPTSNGSILLDPNSGIDVNGAVYKKAEETCKDFQPNGGRRPSPPPGGQPKVDEYVNCMRKNGQPGFPTRTRTVSSPPEENGIDVKSPEFKAAHKACQKFLSAGAPPPAWDPSPPPRGKEAPAPR